MSQIFSDNETFHGSMEEIPSNEQQLSQLTSVQDEQHFPSSDPQELSTAKHHCELEQSTLDCYRQSGILHEQQQQQLLASSSDPEEYLSTSKRQEGFGSSTLERYREVGFIKDVQQSTYLWDFVAVPNRLFRVSIPKTLENSSSDWVHFKVYKDSVGRMELYQITFLSVSEVRKVLWRLPGILKQAFEYFDHLTGCVRPIPVSEKYNYPSETEDLENAHKTWEICCSSRRKIMISCVFYDANCFEKTFFQFKVFTRPCINNMFMRKSRLSVKVSELRNLVDSSCNIAESLIRDTIRQSQRREFITFNNTFQQ